MVNNQPVIINTQIETVVKNYIFNNIFTAPAQGKQPTFLLLLDTDQICQVAGYTMRSQTKPVQNSQLGNKARSIN